MAGTQPPNTLVARGGGRSSAVPTGASSTVRRRPTRGGGSGGKLQQNVMNFYTDDSPGLKISPVVVITMSLGFIAFVTILHVIGKFQRASVPA